jgi:alpha-amylase
VGSDWIRSDDALSGYDRGGASDTLMSLSGLPDFKTESTREVGLPPLLREKWTAEGRLDQEQGELDAFFEKNKLPKTVLNYEIKWLTDWVAEYGIDGFRCDTAKHVDQTCWAELKKYASLALEEWRKANPGKTDYDTPFWTVGEAWDHGVVKDAYFETGMFDAMINFSFRKNLLKGYSILPKLYTFMSDTMRGEDINALSYISSHDTALYTRSNLIKGGTALLLAPGAVQIYYGDETARPAAWPDTPYADQKLRSDMNWENPDEAVFAHFCILGTFRSRHPAVGAGIQTEIQAAPYIFARVCESGSITDTIVVVIGDANVNTSIPVNGFFEEGDKVRNAYDGTEAVVKDGSITFTTGENGVILLEKAD